MQKEPPPQVSWAPIPLPRVFDSSFTVALFLFTVVSPTSWSLYPIVCREACDYVSLSHSVPHYMHGFTLTHVLGGGEPNRPMLLWYLHESSVRVMLHLCSLQSDLACSNF
jgi:hypothetical protein